MVELDGFVSDVCWYVVRFGCELNVCLFGEGGGDGIVSFFGV